jgi:hypothetical protein
MARIPLTLALTALVAALAAAPAGAKTTKVPYGFYGATLTTDLLSARLMPDAALDQQAALMANSGVESLRVVVDWLRVEPAKGKYSFWQLDRLVRITANHHLPLFINMSASPKWASSAPGSPEFWRAPPKDPASYAKLMTALVGRYGPKGSFWTQNRGVPKTPIRQWQVWNEPTAPWFWSKTPFARSYVKVLRAAYKAIHRADRGATVVTGGLVTAPRSPWETAGDLYRRGGKGTFDVLAVHPFSNDVRSTRNTVKRTLEVVRRVRKVMKRNHDLRRRIALTEVTWPAALGQVPASAINGLETTAPGMAARLSSTYRAFALRRRQLGLSQVFWFTWASEYNTNSSTNTQPFRYAGLVKRAGTVFTPMPVLTTFSAVAARYEGCRKSGGNASRCR